MKCDIWKCMAHDITIKYNINKIKILIKNEP